ncbi:choline BCCT transporter BetT [Cysteiniphilum sp. QT6929]|uniref:BCCT family transporter n=1 Tax=Cysteiniphilum sp. QT6929 TaxID=2975055 RepID=UPI0024B35995|nr:choline BCCT transporter BetT [Cysteiniphilum sp. QT6929]WHN64904.1 choline BCCT transporter BetT [Cysteiniphilum sp. QT6929]
MSRQKGAYAPVFYPSIILIVLFALIGVLWPEHAKLFFASIQGWLTLQTGWLYILGMAIFVCLCIFLMVSRLGDIKLGPDHSLPEHSSISWFAMLFAAGMGIGLMFFSVAEPLQHYLSPPDVSASNSILAAKDAMNVTFFHWGLQAWSVYAIVGLALAYFSYRHKLPLLPRSVLYPLIGKRIYGVIGHVVDVFAILGTMFGIATSLGLGATQVNAGLHFLFNIPVNVPVQTILIIIITLIATASVALGLEKGIKLLSNFNIIVAILLLLFVLFLGGFTSLLQAFVQNTGSYLSSIVNKTFNLYAYENKQGWLSGWTLFYWGWWIAWSPFVGMFIAKVSKGRTIREFLVGVLFIPTGFTFLWLSVFGNSAINLVLHDQSIALVQAVQHNIPVALFEFLQHFPLSSITSILALILLVTFFVTSADSGSLVIDIIATANAKKSIVWQRIFWSLLEGFLAISLLYSGGLAALQTATIASAFPFLIVLFFMCIALVKALREDYLRLSSIQTHSTAVQYTSANSSWQQRLDGLLMLPNRVQALTFLRQVVQPAIEKVGTRISKELEVQIVMDEDKVRLLIPKSDDIDFVYSVHIRAFALPSYAEDDGDNEQDKGEQEKHYYRAEVFLEHGGQQYDIMGYTEEQVIADILTQYEKHLYYIHVSNADRALI